MSLSAGTRLGPYEIHSLIGAGGMGEVYRARDPRLGRDVAIKVLPESAGGPHLRRFEQEARAVAALSHPNVLAIYDVGVGTPPYLVTELLDGETLRERMTRSRLALGAILDTARQFLSGLAAAHARGIVHRDLKPDNIFLTRDGVVKILDFGLAKSVVAAAAVSELDATQAAVTVDGAIMGTVGYMAPEQVRGAAVDHRSDIFAVGAVLYEMSTGDRAFRGDSPADTMSAILREQPPEAPLSGGVPPALARIVQRCLEKSPEQRFQSAQDLRFALEGLSQTDVPVRTPSPDDNASSIAVLPFTDMSAQRDQAYFCEGMAEEIINALARVEGLRVAPRTSTFQIHSTTADLGQLAGALGVRHLLEGSVRTAGQRLRVTAQVVDVRDRRAVWSDRFDGELADVFDIQETIASRIVAALKARLIGGGSVEPVRRQYTPSVEAYQAYLQGLHHRYTTYDLVESLRSFERAAELDPRYADAHMGVAYVSAVLANFAFLSPSEARMKSRAAIAKAMAIDANLPVAHATLGWWTALHEWNFPRAEQIFEHALSLDDACIEAHAFFGLMCGTLQREDDCVAHMSRLVQLDPLSPWTHGVSAFAHHTLGRDEVALRESATALGLRPESMIGLWCKGMALRGLKRFPEAIATFERAVELMPSALYLLCELGCTCAQAGESARAEGILRTLDERAARVYVAPFWRGTILFGLGRVDEAFADLERAFHEGAPMLPFLGASWWDQARGQARFADLVKRIGLPPSVAQARRP
jgi:eukaryotic-like serine/threonine-protein kinase